MTVLNCLIFKLYNKETILQFYNVLVLFVMNPSEWHQRCRKIVHVVLFVTWWTHQQQRNRWVADHPSFLKQSLCHCCNWCLLYIIWLIWYVILWSWSTHHGNCITTLLWKHLSLSCGLFTVILSSRQWLCLCFPFTWKIAGAHATSILQFK